MRKNILISSQTKVRLESLKKGLSFDAYLAKVADYFENTGAKLEDGQQPITRLVIDQANRVIEVVRGIEKKQLNLFKSLANRIGNSEEGEAAGQTLAQEDLAMVQTVLARNEELEKRVKDLERDKAQMQAILAVQDKSPVETSSGVADREQMLALLDKLQGAFRHSPVEKDRYFISKSEANAIISEMEQIVKK